MKLAIGRVNQNQFYFQRFEPTANIVDGGYFCVPAGSQKYDLWILFNQRPLC